MNAEFFAALEQLEKEKGIPVDYMLDRVCQALLTAYKKDNDGLKCDNVYVEPDMDEKTIHMYASKEVVDEAEDPLTEISLEDAKKISPRVSLGDFVQAVRPHCSTGCQAGHHSGHPRVRARHGLQ